MLKAKSKSAVEDPLRVKSGVIDTHFPDVPTGGPAGELVEGRDDEVPKRQVLADYCYWFRNSR